MTWRRRKPFLFYCFNGKSKQASSKEGSRAAFKWRLPEWGFQMKIGLKFRKHRGIHFRTSECIVEISAEVRVTHSSSPKPPCITCTRHEELSRINSSLTLAKTLTWYLQTLAVVWKTCASGEGALWLCSIRDLPVQTHACMSAHGKCLKQVIPAQVRVYTQRLTWDSNRWDIRELYNVSSKSCVSHPPLLLSLLPSCVKRRAAVLVNVFVKLDFEGEFTAHARRMDESGASLCAVKLSPKFWEGEGAICGKCRQFVCCFNAYEIWKHSGSVSHSLCKGMNLDNRTKIPALKVQMR